MTTSTISLLPRFARCFIDHADSPVNRIPAVAWSVVQRGMALIGMLVLSPVLAVVALAVRADTPGPAVYRSTRISQGRPFTILKFRSMRAGADPGLRVTSAGDPRVTRIGRFLRRAKLDELPQLWNVVRGEMLLVGPRPEDPIYVDLEDPLHRAVFGARPGITGPTVLAFHDEEFLLAGAAREIASAAGREYATAEDIDRAYRERIQPRKLEMDAAYLRTRSVRGDLAVLAGTIGHVLRRAKDP
jgi:lipopolysaccharide/colanic/teichoic acid biosynthesis glycosyltransferase